MTRIVRDPSGYRRFHAEATDLVGALEAGLPPIEQARALHTLKGSAAVVGLSGLSSTCDAIEVAVAEEGLFAGHHLRSLQTAWRNTEAMASRYRSLFAEDRAEVTGDQLAELQRATAAGLPRADICAALRRWRMTPVGPTLPGLADHAAQVAQTLRRELDVEVRCDDVRLDATQASALWGILSHVVRNAVDHGIEPVDERLRARKPRRGRLVLQATAEHEHVVLRIQDDGRGIDWAALRSRAERVGHPHATAADLVDAMFADGVSTRSEITAISGRGVGLASVKSACERLGIRIDVASRRGEGTEVTFSFASVRASDNPASNAPTPDTHVP